MNRIFRNIRQVLLSQNRIWKYLLYALGEILLVVIGIYIALLINTSQKYQQDTKKLQTYLSLLVEDLEKDKIRLKECIESDSIKTEYCNQYINSNKPMISLVIFRYSFRQASIIIHDATYNAMKSNGILEFIQSIETQKAISEYYANLDFVKQNENIHINNQVASYTENVLKIKRLVQFFHQLNGPVDSITLNNKEESIIFGSIVNIRDLAKIEVERYKNALKELNELKILIQNELNKSNHNSNSFE